ncbi:TIGR02680 family protein [Paenibacillus oenotherae]|uniref:TIGR02680 family protein n=1 Tax=Paenibacillus oenotherae TaxID=1435645 RepID=A0ABS7D305_9BACL|nr:TIGR02680 family protein [Paenibacillus oenotherae]MBW7474310.1 TIGR02680 family protein [Paenibacillus oenotherae]
MKKRSNPFIPAAVGYINFWVYTQEEYDFYKGNILFGGENGQGKSVSMQSIIPLLLDGNKHPSRIDPFGTSKKKLIDYMKVNDEIVPGKISYLYIVYERERTKDVVTTGLGLRSKSDGTVESWGFIVKGERPGSFFSLVESEGFNENGVEVFKPKTKQQLREELKKRPNATFTDGQSEYATAVNNVVFNFAGGVDQLKELTNLLIQVRSPKLSKELKPSILYDALKYSLPELSFEVVSRISNTIKDIDDRNRQIERTEQDLELARILSLEYKKYLEATLRNASTKFVEAKDEKDKATKLLKNTQDDMHKKRAIEIRTNDELEDMNIELSVKENKLDTLESPELRSLNNRMISADSEKTSKEQELQDKQDKLEDNNKRLFHIQGNVKRFEENSYQLEKSIQAQIRDIQSVGEEIQFHENESYLTSAKAHLEDCRKDNQYFNSWLNRLNDHIKKLKHIIKLFTDENNAKEKMEQKKADIREIDLQVLDATKEYNKALDVIEREKEAFKREFRLWLHKNEVFTIPQSVIGYLMNVVENLFEVDNMTAQMVEHELAQIKEKLLKPIEDRFSENRAAIINTQNDIESLKKEIDELHQVKEVEPRSRRQKTKQQRTLLEQQGIPFIPFYEAVDFREGVSEETKERIESALLDMGLLDALIVSEKHREKVNANDAVIIPNKDQGKHKDSGLSSILKVVPPKTEIVIADIESVLLSISMEDLNAETSISKDGKYKHGLLQGYAVEQPLAAYIGEEARKRFREESIRQKEEMLEKAEHELKALKENETAIQDKKKQLQEEYNKRPVLDKIKSAYDEMRIKKRFKEQEILKQEKVKKLHQELVDIFNRKHNERTLVCQSLEGATTLESVSSMLEIAEDECRDKIIKLSNMLHTFSTNKIELEMALDNLEQAEQADEQLRDEISLLERGIKRAELLIKEIEEQLNKMDYEGIKQQIEITRNRINQLKEDIPKKIQLHAEVKSKREDLEVKIEDLKHVEAYKAKMLLAREEVLENELHARKVDGITDLYAYAKEHANEEPIKIESAIEKMSNALNRARFNGLENYTVQSIRVPYGSITFSEEDFGEDKDKRNSVELLVGERERLNITLSVDGFKINPSEFHDYLLALLEEQKQFLRKDEEALIQDVMIQGTGEQINELIKKAKKWKDDINVIMADMKNSIDLRLIWEPIAKDDKQASLSTLRLVELLGRDFNTLKDEDIEALSDHFMSKIYEAKDKLLSGSDVQNLEQALKQVLDYREWYQFKIMYTIEGQKEKTLNEDNLALLSGGERAMAIYIPLFSATYSKYTNAGEDAPYIVALDEAYAGVDDNNISEMFGIMKQYQFNYILTSQALWADYETVPGINIYVLSFDKTNRVVTSEPWKWDGQKIAMNEEMLKKRGVVVDDDGELELKDGVQVALDFDFVATKETME